MTLRDAIRTAKFVNGIVVVKNGEYEVVMENVLNEYLEDGWTRVIGA